MSHFSRRQLERLEERHLLTSVSFVKHEISTVFFDVLTSADLDGDMVPDLVAASSQKEEYGLVWFPSLHAAGSISEPIPFEVSNLPEDYINDEFNAFVWNELSSIESIAASDIDNDGDQDIAISGTDWGWLENTSGDGSAWNWHHIGWAGYSSVFADLNGDDRLDAAVLDDSWLITYSNNGNGEFAVTEHEDIFFPRVPELLQFARISGGSHLDLVVRYDDSAERTTSYFRHEYLEDGFGGPHAFEPNWQGDSLTKYHFADVDSDGDDDLVATNRDSVGWILNDDGEFQNGPVNVVEMTSFGIASFYPADLDQDGDLDLVLAAGVPLGGGGIEWFDNADGFGTLGSPSKISVVTGFSFYRLAVADFDGDGDTDVVGVGHDQPNSFLALYEQRRIGDADDNGEVDFADFLALSANFGTVADAVWEQGDFNADGNVDFADFLLLSKAFV